VNGLISQTLSWIEHPKYTDSEPLDWFAFALLAFLLGMLWSKVLKQIVE
jgi:hypothetical protein